VASRKYIPAKTVSIKHKDPSFITPVIKALLRIRNRLRRFGHLEKANIIANKINHMIVDNRKNALIHATSSDVGKLWTMLRKTENWGCRNSTLDNCGNVDDVNKYFTSVVCDKHIQEKLFCLSCTVKLMLMMHILQLKQLL